MAESIKAYLKAGHTVADFLRYNSMRMSENGCWHWLGALTSEDYGFLYFQGKRMAAHRLSYETFVGPIPKGIVLDHLCRDHTCINPDHLDPCTPGENVRRGISHYGSRTHCEAGHPYTSENTAINKAYDSRQCRICKRISNQKYKAAHKAELADKRREKNKANPEAHKAEQHAAYLRRIGKENQHV